MKHSEGKFRFSNQLPAHIRVFGKLNRLLQYTHTPQAMGETG